MHEDGEAMLEVCGKRKDGESRLGKGKLMDQGVLSGCRCPKDPLGACDSHCR